MQFAVPPRKGHAAPPYGHSSFLTFQRRKQLKLVAILNAALLSLFILWPQFSSNNTGLATSSIGTGGVVIVTVLDRASYSDTYLQKIMKNRNDYAERHGYTNIFANLSDYEPYIGSSPQTWGTVLAVRHAMASHPTATYFFHLDAHALLMNPSESLESRFLNKHRLEALMRRDVPVVPPDSIIKTFAHLRAEDIDLVLTNDAKDLNTGSFVLRQGDFARFLLDTWFDPLYRSYNFAKAELHSLEHIVQWHPTVLARLALVPQRVINSYSKDSPGASVDGTYKDGDLLVRFFGCDTDPARNCEWEMEPYYKLWAKRVKLE
ncbi:galactosyl transferase GMA12/MNN10 family-domain-containing protein [Aspergillus filifer]